MKRVDRILLAEEGTAVGPPSSTGCYRSIRGPRDTLVGGKRHVTLTGWDRDDYRLVRGPTDVVVLLQMANPDVTDTTLRLLGGLEPLRELDLNNTPATDAGLALLAQLPALQRLRRANTPITDSAFRQHLASNPRLCKLDPRDAADSSRPGRGEPTHNRRSGSAHCGHAATFITCPGPDGWPLGLVAIPAGVVRWRSDYGSRSAPSSSSGSATEPNRTRLLTPITDCSSSGGTACSAIEAMRCCIADTRSG